MTNPLDFVPNLRQTWGADNSGNLRRAYDKIMAERGYMKERVKKNDVIIIGEMNSAAGDYGEWEDFTCFHYPEDRYEKIAEKYKTSRGVKKAILDDFFGKGSVRTEKASLYHPTFFVSNYGMRVYKNSNETMSGQECFVIPENMPVKESASKAAISVQSSGKLEKALSAVIDQIGFPSTKGTGKCICYGGMKKCGNLSALWSDSAYGILSDNGLKVKNAQDLIELNINDELKNFNELQLRGGFALCNPNLK